MPGENSQVASSDYEQPISTNNILTKMWPILSAFVANRLKRAVELRLKKHQPATVRPRPARHVILCVRGDGMLTPWGIPHPICQLEWHRCSHGLGGFEGRGLSNSRVPTRYSPSLCRPLGVFDGA